MTMQMHFRKWPVVLGLSTFFLFDTFTGAQTTPMQSPPPSNDNERSDQDRDITRRELASFDKFLDSHREIAEQVRKNPSLVDNQQFLKDHPALQAYVQQHPAVREELRENPNAFMSAENRYDRNEDANRRGTDRDQNQGDRDITRRELASFDKFLDSHHEIAEQVRKNPSLVDNQQFLKDHPALQAYVQQHPEVREELKENPNAFMSAENRYDRNEDANRRGTDRDQNQGDRDITRRELASFDKFLDSHHEIAEQVRKNPSLVDNQQFLKDHPALQAYVQQHPEVREELRENPNAFMSAENRYDRNEDANRRGTDRDQNQGDRDITRRELGSFDKFLDSHHEIAEQVRKNPSLVDNQQFLKDHPALQAYVQQHPEVREELKENPNAFMSAENRYDRNEDANRRGTDRDQNQGDRDITRRELGSFDKFLDSHHEIAEQVRKNPSLVDNQQFLKDHPALQAYVQQHPEVREELKENPNAFMSAENRYDRHEPEPGRIGAVDDAHRHFGEFLAGHSNIAKDLSKDPSLVKKDAYIHEHPELQEYLSAHPEVKQQLMADPQAFLKSMQQVKSTGVKSTPTAAAPTTAQPKP